MWMTWVFTWVFQNMNWTELGSIFTGKTMQQTTLLQWWLNNDLVEWERVISALRTMKEPVLADAVAVVCKCESLHESPTEESQRGDKNIRKIKLLDAKLKEVEKLLDKEWERGENE